MRSNKMHRGLKRYVEADHSIICNDDMNNGALKVAPKNNAL
jgi:hypothetical protein